jgi:DNA polymerase-4
MWAARTRVAKAAPALALFDELAAVQCEVLARTGMRVGIGAARSETVARTASRLEPGRGVCVVAPGTERSFLAPLPLQRLAALPDAALRVLRASGLVTIGELQRVPKAALQAEFGTAEGLRIWRSARGLDPFKARSGRQPRLTGVLPDAKTRFPAGPARRIWLGTLLAELRAVAGGIRRKLAF